jgi:hypothetical protein
MTWRADLARMSVDNLFLGEGCGEGAADVGAAARRGVRQGHPGRHGERVQGVRRRAAGPLTAKR